MQPVKPFSLSIDGDSKDRIMARSGEIVGFSKTRVVWRFGFMPDSDMARAFNASCDSFTWVIAGYNGRIFDTFKGYGLNLPERFKKIIES